MSAKEGQRPPGTQGVVETARFGWLAVLTEGSSSRGIEYDLSIEYPDEYIEADFVFSAASFLFNDMELILRWLGALLLGGDG